MLQIWRNASRIKKRKVLYKRKDLELMQVWMVRWIDKSWKTVSKLTISWKTKASLMNRTLLIHIRISSSKNLKWWITLRTIPTKYQISQRNSTTPIENKTPLLILWLLTCTMIWSLHSWTRSKKKTIAKLQNLWKMNEQSTAT